MGHGNQSHHKYWVRTPEQTGITRAAEKTVLTNQAQRNGKERSVLPNPGGVGMKNNSFTSVIRKPHAGARVKDTRVPSDYHIERPLSVGYDGDRTL